MLTRLLLVGVGGFLGAVGRYGVSLALGSWTHDFPLATFLVNITGSFALGLVATVVVGRLDASENMQLLIGTGFIGAYTTFSTFELETHRLMQSGSHAWALVYVISSIVCGYAAVHLAVLLTR